MKTILKLTLLSYLLISIGSCIKIPQPCAKDYAFEFPISVTPRDTFILGDTIWWEMDLPNVLLDHTSGEYIDLTEFELFFGFIISEVDSTILINGSGQTQQLELIQDVGRIKQRQSTFFYTYIETQSIQQKKFRIGCVLRKLGTFSSEIYFPEYYTNRDHSLRDELQIVDPDCEETLTFYSKIIANSKDNNHYMIDGICKYTTDGRRICYPTLEEVENYGYYAFHVKEP